MEDEVQHIYSSTPFEFVVKGESFYIHRALIAEVSKPLERMMNNGMSETHIGRAVLEDEDVATFARFSGWAYAGFYTAAECSERAQDEAQEEVNETVEDASCVSEPSTFPRKSKKTYANNTSFGFPKSKESLKEAFVKLRFCKADDERPSWTPRANVKPSEDYTNVLLSHIQLYVFAEKYDIESLQRLTLQNLHQTLAAFNLWPACVDDVVTLLRFAYEHTSAKPDNGWEPMRSMLSRYVHCEMDQLVDHVAFRDLLADDRDFLDDFCIRLRKRVE